MSRKKLYVNVANTGIENGLSWQTAYKSLESALNLANNDIYGYEIWVAKGV